MDKSAGPLGHAVDISDAEFRFPPRMTKEVADFLLQEAYGEVDTGRVLRKTIARQREAGLEAASDVQYVGEARVEAYEDGLGVSLSTDIMIHEEFEDLQACVDVFEETLGAEILARLEKKVRKWEKKHA